MRVSETRRYTCGCCGSQVRVVNGKWLRALRLTADITMTHFAKFHAGLSAQFINNIEHNRRLCPSDVEKAYRALASKTLVVSGSLPPVVGLSRELYDRVHNRPPSREEGR